jgi:uncharacterized repeat protein (TIGR03803 family)
MHVLRSVVAACCCGGLMVACGGNNDASSVLRPLSGVSRNDAFRRPPIFANLASSSPHRRSASGNERVLHSFQGSPDGETPQGQLIELNGVLYGTTYAGGSKSKNCTSYSACGTVFSITTSGDEQVIYGFENTPDGAFPSGGALVAVNGALYGTTSDGGAGYHTGGAVFSVSTSGEESIIYSFGNNGDGSIPYAGLIAVKGVLYGTTFGGGTAAGSGTVFSVTTSGVEHLLHSFAGGKDGSTPRAGLVASGGILYGTTSGGGGTSCSASGEAGCGTVFSVTTTGSEKTLYRFKNNHKDGIFPEAALAMVKGTLYGTTGGGGAHSCAGDNGYGCGTVFSISTSGTEHVLHSFEGGSDGWGPYADLIAVKGMLYGVTARGGGSGCYGGYGCGTVFEMSPDGSGYRVLYSFQGGSDGSGPFGGLLELKGALYGVTTQGGGSANCNDGCGTVFTLKP